MNRSWNICSWRRCLRYERRASDVSNLHSLFFASTSSRRFVVFGHWGVERRFLNLLMHNAPLSERLPCRLCSGSPHLFFPMHIATLVDFRILHPTVKVFPHWKNEEGAPEPSRQCFYKPPPILPHPIKSTNIGLNAGTEVMQAAWDISEQLDCWRG